MALQRGWWIEWSFVGKEGRRPPAPAVAAWLRGGVLSGLLSARRPPTNQGRAGQGRAARRAARCSAAQRRAVACGTNIEH